ncbi:MAG: hypothetical protein GY756_23960, partial [bacterium]|nr:hypothetical protein [bacterium]
KRSLQVMDNQDYPYEAILEMVNPRREKGRNPVFDVSIDYIKNEMIENVDLISNLIIEDYPLDMKTASFDLTFYVYEYFDEIRISLNYRTSLFNKETIEYVINQYYQLLKIISGNPNQELREFNLFNYEGKKANKSCLSLLSIQTLI